MSRGLLSSMGAMAILAAAMEPYPDHAPYQHRRRSTRSAAIGVVLGEGVQTLKGTPDAILKPKGKRARRRSKA